MKKYLTKVKDFFIKIAKLTGIQLSLLVLIYLEKVLTWGSFFIAFHFIFLYDTTKSFLDNVPLILMMAGVIAFWFTFVDILKLQAKKTEEDAKSVSGWMIRGLQANKYILLLAGIYYFFTFKFQPRDVYIYFSVVLASRFLAKYIVSWVLRIQKLDWSALDGK